MVRDAGGSPLGYLDLLFDVTARKRTEHRRAVLAEATGILISSLDCHATLDAADVVIVDGCIRGWRTEWDDPDGWAADGWPVVLMHDAERAWRVLLLLVERAPDDVPLSLVGAGPMEDFINEHAPELVGRIEERSRRDPRFREAMSGAWLSAGALPADVEERVVRASAGGILLLGDTPPDSRRRGKR